MRYSLTLLVVRIAVVAARMCVNSIAIPIDYVLFCKDRAIAIFLTDF